MATILDILSWAFLLMGAFLGISGAVGMFRLPDLFTRMHAASVTDTLCAFCIVVGLALQSDSVMMVLKLALIILIIAYTSPTAAHALAKAALRGGEKPILYDEGDSSSLR